MNKTLYCGTGFNLSLYPMPNSMIPAKFKKQYEAMPETIRSYVFSPKADGVRYFLVLFHNRQNPPARIAALVDRTNTIYELPADDLPERAFAGTVLDGELTRIGNRYVFLAFDCLMCYGNKTATLRYDHRIEIARDVLFRLNNKVLEGRIPVNMGADAPYCLPITMRPETSHMGLPIGKIPFLASVKPIFDMSGLQHYFTHYANTLAFKFDGLVFTNLQDPAYPFRMKIDAILKWKPRLDDYSENTIDFMITTRSTPDNILQNLPPKFRDHNLAHFRKFHPHHTNIWLWTMLPDKTAFCFSGGISQVQNLLPNRVYECRWNYRLQNWEAVRLRNKDINQWETVTLTVQNIVEDVKFEELI
jgi:hypothetical protein